MRVSPCVVCSPQAKARKVIVRKARQAVEAMTRPQELETLQVRHTCIWLPGGDSLRQEVR